MDTQKLLGGVGASRTADDRLSYRPSPLAFPWQDPPTGDWRWTSCLPPITAMNRYRTRSPQLPLGAPRPYGTFDLHPVLFHPSPDLWSNFVA
jgi:hypothetical protein